MKVNKGQWKNPCPGFSMRKKGEGENKRQAESREKRVDGMEVSSR